MAYLTPSRLEQHTSMWHSLPRSSQTRTTLDRSQSLFNSTPYALTFQILQLCQRSRVNLRLSCTMKPASASRGSIPWISEKTCKRRDTALDALISRQLPASITCGGCLCMCGSEG
ncbi:hypothetical protein T440DRAFT_60819 [Plenodomus tracheiphilus IPT5]|uniref:Uncharacterized protein n=1 Tax=Plenodomus tracheiphilus IPT5 TaxID=1408161 RepID=A0A6A7ALN8_9PLEO|nr:hypothetical protein T440DRAFT_60819 [Plenodomus tracheiphilus IPT5]